MTFPPCRLRWRALFRAIFPVICGAALSGWVTPARADIDDNLTKLVWKLRYQVPDAKWNDPNWLALDDDGDGISNGAEIAAGTNPFKSDSTIKITSIVLNAGGDAEITFPTVANKKYYLQANNDLTTPSNWADIPNKSVMGGAVDGSSQLITVTPNANTFYRIRVSDVDTDGDQVSDWVEKLTGYNANSAMTDGRTADRTAILAATASFNQVTVTATKLSATEPPDSITPPVEVGSVTVSRGIAKLGSLVAPAITVPLQKMGTATEGMDYDPLPVSVSFPDGSIAYQAGGGANQVVMAINPRANTALRTNVTAIVNAQPGLGYTVGSPKGASVVINPAGTAAGTGLTGKYFSTSSSAYSTTQATIFNGTPAFTRVDPTINFNGISSIAVGNPCVITMSDPHNLVTGNSVTIGGVSGGSFSPAINGTYAVTVTSPTTFTVASNCTSVPSSLLLAYVSGTNGPNGWGASGGPAGVNSASTTFSVRWTGQVLPQYTETYYFDVQSDDSAKLWVDGKLLVDRWINQGATEYANSITLKAGVPYDIQIDYWNVSGSAVARLLWWSPSQTKQVIPQGRLFPAPSTVASKIAAVTNALNVVGYVGTPFTYNLTTPNIGATMTYALADATNNPLPAGLSLDLNTGAITGTPTTAGNSNVPINAINSTNSASPLIAGSSILNFTIYPVGGVTREIVGGSMPGTKVSDIAFPPDSTFSPAANHGTIATIEDDVDYSANTGERLRGYLVPPKTGNYYFWLSANNAAELWISNDSQSINKVRRAYIVGGSGKKSWASAASSTSQQQTPWLSLVSGQKYYFEVLHNTGADVDSHVAVGWCQDDIGTVPAFVSAANPAGVTPLIPDGDGPLSGYPLSGRAPGYIFQPYDYPSTGAAVGTLYSTDLGPQGSSTTKASGSGNLRVDPSGTFATLHFSYGGLSSPRTAYHLHSDSFATHSQGEIIFDIDDVDSFHPELKTADGGYIWNFTPVGSFTSTSQIMDAISQGKVYLNIHTVSFPSGEIRGNMGLVDGSQTPPDPSLYVEPTASLDSNSNDAQIARFLNQATFGASPTDVAYVKANGFQAWITDQLSKTGSHTSDDVVNGLTADINNPYPSTLFTDTWWKYSITGPDQLRQRLASALSEIMVVSWNNNTGPLQNNGRILAGFYDQLVDYCLPTSGLTDSGTFRGILKAVTLTPAMGLYLDMRANQKGDDTIGRHPNENYAREIMQLFSIGLNRMWDDGKFVLDSNANLVPTYTQSNILGMAALFTGWNYSQANQSNGRLPSNFSPAADYLNPMVLVPTQHDLNPKLLLNNVVIPGATGLLPRVSIASIGTSVVGALTPSCTVNTASAHGLKVGDTIRIGNVSGGTFGAGTSINGSFQVGTVLSATSFAVPITCSSTSGMTLTNAIVTGATVLSPNTSVGGSAPLAAISGSQADNSGTTLPHPYDQYGLTELERAMDNIVNNDNVPPYICRQLIQRLVTSDPSPGYLYRVVQKFKDNGVGARGDLSAVVKQILLDGEARSFTSASASPKFGKQREPMLRLTGAARAFPAASYSGTYSQLTGINSNKLRIVSSLPNNFSSGFSVSLNFRGNYTTTTPPNPYTNPTSTTYSIQTSLGIAQTYTDIASIGTGNPTVITTTQPHGLATGNTVTISGVSGSFIGTNINTTQTVTVIDATRFSIPINTVRAFQVASIATGNPCTITTAQAHNLTTGTSVTFNGVTGGAFSSALTITFTATVTGTNTFTIASNCTSPPTAYLTWREVSNPCRVTTVGPHGLSTGASVTISGVSGGTFTPTINNTFSVTVLDPTSFTVPVSCTSVSTANTGSIVGGNTLDVLATGMSNVTFAQAAGTNVMTVNTSGPTTDIVVPSGGGTTLKSKVYLAFLSRSSTASISSISTGNPARSLPRHLTA